MASPMKERVAQVRGVLAERVVVSTHLDLFLSLRALAAYSSLSSADRLLPRPAAEPPLDARRLSTALPRPMTVAEPIVLRSRTYD